MNKRQQLRCFPYWHRADVGNPDRHVIHSRVKYQLEGVSHLLHPPTCVFQGGCDGGFALPVKSYIPPHAQVMLYCIQWWLVVVPSTTAIAVTILLLWPGVIIIYCADEGNPDRHALNRRIKYQLQCISNRLHFPHMGVVMGSVTVVMRYIFPTCINDAI
jgi:hypothetical protein